jgi:AcrR family transcriptional regulator
MSRSVKRAYDASSRRAQAELARQRIVDSARPLFVEHGYEATSMRELAATAGVSLQTLYNAFESKFGLFSAVMNVIVAGDHEPIALADRPEVRSFDQIEDATELIGAAVDVALPILARVDEIFPVLRAAASSDPEVAAAYQRFVIDARYADHLEVGRRLHQLEALRAGVDANRATDVLWTVLSPDCYHLLVVDRGWSGGEFADWAHRSLVSALLDTQLSA